jgi:hypothetical protein
VIHRAAAVGGAPQPIRVDLYRLHGRSNDEQAWSGRRRHRDHAKSRVFVTGFVQSQGQVQVKRNTTVLRCSRWPAASATAGQERHQDQRMVDGKKKDIQSEHQHRHREAR